MAVILKNSNFRKLLVAFALNKIGSWFRRIAITGVLFKITHSAAAVGISFIIIYVPAVFGGILLSKYIDKIEKKKLMILANLVGFFFAFMLYLWSYHLTSFIIYTFLIFLSIADATYEPARVAITPEIVTDSASYASAVSYLRVTKESTMLMGTAIGGVLISLIGLKYIFFIDSISYLVSAILNYSMHIYHFDKENNLTFLPEKYQSVVKNLKIALKEVSNSQILIVTLLLATFRQFTYGIAVIAFTMIVLRKFQLNETWLGWSYTMGGIGSIVGGVYMRRILSLPLIKRITGKNLLFVLSLINALMLLLMFIAPTVMLFMIMILLHDITMIMTEIISETNIGNYSANNTRGRVSSLFFSNECFSFLMGAIFYTSFMSSYSINTIGVILFVVLLIGILFTYFNGLLFAGRLNEYQAKKRTT